MTRRICQKNTKTDFCVMMKKWHLIGIIKRIVNMKRWDSTVSPKRNILDFLLTKLYLIPIG